MGGTYDGAPEEDPYGVNVRRKGNGGKGHQRLALAVRIKITPMLVRQRLRIKRPEINLKAQGFHNMNIAILLHAVAKSRTVSRSSSDWA